jgi:hypothetical protein
VIFWVDKPRRAQNLRFALVDRVRAARFHSGIGAGSRGRLVRKYFLDAKIFVSAAFL